MQKSTAVILAAGEGKRMNSRLPKVLHPICGRTLLGHVLTAVENLCGKKIVVVGHGAQDVKAAFGESVVYAYQEEQLGTGHAVMQAADQIPADGSVFILCGDTPLLDEGTLQGLFDTHQASGAAATVLTAVVPEPFGYGRIIRLADGSVKKIVEEKDATDMERKIAEINTGSYIFSATVLLDTLKGLDNDNTQGEYYLTDCIELIIGKALKVASHCLADHRLALGVNDRMQLAQAQRLLQEKINAGLMKAGVTMDDPGTTYVDADAIVGRDTILLPNTMVKGKSVIGEDCAVGPNCEITDSIVGSGVTIRHSVITGAKLEDGVSVGPFAHLRPETILRAGVKVGDFVEIKKSDIGMNSKIPHLSYVGDAQVGKSVNLGAGTIVVNYDGKNKHVTIIEDESFVGCNSNLVAPLCIGKGAFVAAGSTITKDVPPGALSLARPKQENKEGLATRLLSRDKGGES